MRKLKKRGGSTSTHRTGVSSLTHRENTIFSKLAHRWNRLTPLQKAEVILLFILGIGVFLILLSRLMNALNKTTTTSHTYLPKPEPSFQELKQRIQKTSIQPAPEIKPLLTKSASAKELVKTQQKILRENLHEASHPTVLKEILSDPTFHIEVTHDAIIKAYGEYDGVENKFSIAMDILKDPQFISPTLKNEMHSASIRSRNFQKLFEENPNPPKDSVVLSSPYLTKNWKIDSYQQIEFEQAVKDVENNMKEFANQFARYQNKALSKLEAEEFENTVLNQFSDYTPPTREIQIPKALWASFQQKYQPENQANLKGIIAFRDLYPEVPADLMPVSITAYIRHIVPDGNMILVRYDYAQDSSVLEKAKAFIGRYYENLYRFQYGTNIYSQTHPEEIPLEKSSDYEESRPWFPRSIFGSWCDFFSKFHEVKDYCETATPTPTPKQNNL